MQKLIFFLFFTLIYQSLIIAQYNDYIGAGHSDGITVTSSSQKNELLTNYIAKAENTINGKGMDAQKMEASRFLAQASLGADMASINEVASFIENDTLGIEAWLEKQFELEAYGYVKYANDIFEITNQWQINHGVDSSYLPPRVNWKHFQYAWWEYNLFNDDLLRQKVAFALSEILVLSLDSNLKDMADGVASYYDILSNNAFGNYRDILKQVSYHPAMGFYLTHFNNPKADTSINNHPDENYAREVMQLFSIGLYMLNNDGTRKIDGNGNFIPTYTNSDIKEMAKVFTGLGAGKLLPNDFVDSPTFNLGIDITDLTHPMKMYDYWHQKGEKHLLNGYVIPDGKTGDEDIELAITHLFNHPNVGPFICKQLIQRMVKSNPTPQYVDRVASVFNNNGDGIRGDMKAVVKAILLDEEARSCDWINHPANGRLKEPVLRYVHFARAIDKDQSIGVFLNSGHIFKEKAGQMIMTSPSVFNFFLPYFQPNGVIADNGLIAPEFQIHNSKTSIGYINNVYDWTRGGIMMRNLIDHFPSVSTDFFKYEPMAKDIEVLLNYLDVLFTYGMMSDRTRSIIKENCNGFNWGEFKENRSKLALNLLMISPDYNISK